MLISEKLEPEDINSGNTHVITNVTIEIIAAIIWFSVRLDANIPKAIYAIHSKPKPNKVIKAVGISGVPKKHIIPIKIEVNNNAINTIINADINLASTILVILIGEVKSNCSVPFFLSSEKDLIVSIGIKNANTNIVGKYVKI